MTGDFDCSPFPVHRPFKYDSTFFHYINLAAIVGAMARVAICCLRLRTGRSIESFWWNRIPGAAWIKLGQAKSLDTMTLLFLFAKVG